MAVGERLKAPFTLDLRSLALLRMGLGGLVVLDVLLRLRDLTTFYTDAGVLPRAVPIVEAMMALVLADHLLRWKAQCGS